MVIQLPEFQQLKLLFYPRQILGPVLHYCFGLLPVFLFMGISLFTAPFCTFLNPSDIIFIYEFVLYESYTI